MLQAKRAGVSDAVPQKSASLVLRHQLANKKSALFKRWRGLLLLTLGQLSHGFTPTSLILEKRRAGSTTLRSCFLPFCKKYKGYVAAATFVSCNLWTTASVSAFVVLGTNDLSTELINGLFNPFAVILMQPVIFVRFPLI